VYDQSLASDMATERIKVIDTTPPKLSVDGGVCLWPPNHAFALFTLGNELSFNVSDSCDASPRVWIDSVVSNEPALAQGSGNTTPDVVFGTQAACVRAERAGPGAGRSYTVAIKARDFACNTTTRYVNIVVPHDMSGHPDCQPATGLDVPDARCDAGVPLLPCVAPDP
jgi:hypothetical protein